VSAFVTTGLFWLLAAAALFGAVVGVFAREVMRMALGLGVFLLALAGFFAYYGFGFLALAELFIYVGGVLVLVLFAIMLVQRTGAGVPALESRFSVPALVASAGLSALLFASLYTLGVQFEANAVDASPQALSAALLGPLLPQFELAGLVLLASLVAVVAIVGGDRE